MGHDDVQIEHLTDHLLLSRAEARYPLFILGAGISFKRVPLLSEIGTWFSQQLSSPSLPCSPWLGDCALRLSKKTATRRDAAEFFSVMQSDIKPIAAIWENFSRAFLSAGFYVASWKKRFHGISSTNVQPSSAHKGLAVALHNARAHVISLNFDGLTHRALTSHQRPGLVLHSVQEIENYFCADTSTFTPSIIKIRGDVFYATCGEPYCPQHLRPYPIDRFHKNDKGQSLRCPSCGMEKLKLQFSFPGYRSKEEIAYPMLAAARQFLGPRISALVLIGLSGRWDRYLLRFIFQFATRRHLPVVDVKPKDGDDLLIDEFRSTYFPSIKLLTTEPIRTDPCFCRIRQPADEFVAALGKTFE